MSVLRAIDRAMRREEGAALVTVLLLVAVMAAGAAITFDALGYTIKRTTARRVYDQARYFALGGEQLAVAAAEKISRNKVQLLEPQTVSYPIEGGRIDGVISDDSNCFNVNSLVEYGDGGSLRVRPKALIQYRRLLTLLGLADREAQHLAATLTDWIDSDSRPLSQGAEDYDYSNLNPPYRAANTLMADLSELTMVQGYNADVLALVRPYLCLTDDTLETVLNVNTLSAGHAPLLAAIVGGALDLPAAGEVIAGRPVGGYDEVGEFWLAPGLRNIQAEQDIRSQTNVKASRFKSRVRVTYYEATSYLTSYVFVDNSGLGRLVSHQFGVVQ